MTAVSNADSTKTANATVVVNTIDTPPVITVHRSGRGDSGRHPDTTVHHDVDRHTNLAVTWSVDGAHPRQSRPSAPSAPPASILRLRPMAPHE